ncbi:type II toxin-antitoxin system RelE/ParE family toxin [Geminocystis herdmanii]|uniref:type II toxin-antitoxin system RelE/ParE family toxin n=1 Tax=Geminocystis herdmanii TaxID=669359 RepID=UPI00034810B0|nr:type II toxin-antitoxin system RelE/ParE family toxin [Geminocystis herdmanii]
MEVQPKELKIYLTSEGKSPFEEWLNSIKDQKTQAIIDNRLRRIRLGNLGDCKSLGYGIFELIIDYGSGYRIYFGQIKNTVILLLCGGDKSTQKKDIIKAQEYWQDYANRENTNQ